jgi:hypothetical protein
LFQGAPESNPDLKGVPLVRDLARNDEERQAIDISKIYSTPKPIVEKVTGLVN